MRQLNRNWIAIGLSLLVGLLALNAGIAYQKTSQIRQSAALVAHTHEVMDALESLLSTVNSAETGQRGYLITKSATYLKPYEDAIARYGGELGALATLTSDNPAQKQEIPKLRELIERRFAILADSIALETAGKSQEATAIVLGGEGQKYMRAIRQLVGEMKDRERALLVEREAADDVAYQSAISSIVAAALLGLVASGAFMWMFRRHLSSLESFADTLFDKQELLQSTLISIGDGVIATDSEGRVTFMNSIAEELTGWNERDAVGESLEKVFHIVNEESRHEVENPALRALREGKIMGLANHTILIAKNGVEWPIDDSAAPIRRRTGEVRGAILVFREIRERKAQEQQLRGQAAALAEADQRKDEFLATLAHELRNPLSPISNAIQLLPLVQDSPGELADLHGIMQRQVHQITRLLDDLMDVSRITRGKFELRKERADVRGLLSSAIESIQPFLTEREHQLQVHVPETPLYVEADTARLTQVFGNILNNAAKYTDRGGLVQVRVEACPGEVQVSVRDNGPGIPPEMLHDVFEMFRQVDGTLERAHGGLGIGLTLVKRIVEAHGGTVEARSAGPGTGAEFVIRLPLAASGDGADVAPRRELRQLNHLPKHRVLVVDDTEASAQTLALMLRAMGQEVSTAFNGEAALRAAAEQRPEVIFLDVAMPHMNGYDVARRLRAAQGQPRPVLVALTGYGQEEDRRRAFEAGFNHHLVKPATVAALEHLLGSLQASGSGATAP
jgi:PAS domain S-box-containing protein